MRACEIRFVVLGLVAGQGCVALPAAPKAEDAGAVAAVEQVLDAGAQRPKTGEPYRGPQCDTAAGAVSAALPDGGARVLIADGGAAGSTAVADAAPVAQPATAGGRGAAAVRAERSGQLVISELMANPAALRDDEGEWIELYNPSPDLALELGGCSLDDGAAVRALQDGVVVPAHGYVTIARSAAVAFSPDLTLSFSLANAEDSVALTCAGTEIDRVRYGAGFPLAAGASMALDPGALDARANDYADAWCLGRDGAPGDLGTPGAPNPPCDLDDAGAP